MSTARSLYEYVMCVSVCVCVCEYISNMDMARSVNNRRACYSRPEVTIVSKNVLQVSTSITDTDNVTNLIDVRLVSICKP